MKKEKNEIMKKNIILIVLMLLLNVFLGAQSNKVPFGKYKFESDKYYESLLLLNNGEFLYVLRKEFLKIETKGNWQLRQDSLILDSSPQKEKMLVWEKRAKGKKKFVIHVYDKHRDFINYNLTAFTQDGDTLYLKSQWEKSVLKQDIVWFTITDAKGLTTPKYTIKGENTNICFVFMESTRVFENEFWLFNDGKITPRDWNGKKQKYFLYPE